ncbi:MAG: CHAD domain-containing protein [Bryobacteraceae bacterium]|nr:CHAD domain-containing protein [Bryobacteraceae bacterium]
MTLRDYAARQVDVLMNRVAAQVDRLAEARDADAIHDFRVSIRRLTQSLRAFAGVLPKKESKQVRKEMKVLMDLAGEVRTRDIALELFDAAKVPPDSAPCVRLALEREDAIAELSAAAARWRGTDFVSRWRSMLKAGSE